MQDVLSLVEDSTCPAREARVEEFGDDWMAPPPDAIGRVVEVSTMLSVFEADRLVRVAALRDEAHAEVGRFGVTREVVERSLRWDLALALGVTEYTAGELLGLADAVVHRYPQALDALTGARVTIGHVRVLVTALDTVEPRLRDDLIVEAVRLAATEPVGVFRRRLTRLVDTVRADTLAERHAAAVAGRRVAVDQGTDGMAVLLAHMPAVEAHAIYARVTAMAKIIKARPGEQRTLDQIRADVIADLLIDGVVAAHPKKARGIRAQVVVTVPALSLLSDADHDHDHDTDTDTDAGADADEVAADTVPPAPTPAGSSHEAPRRVRRDPPVVEGVGPIPMARARELCGGEAGWMRVLTHPESGMVLSVGRKRYRPPRPLQRLAKWRSETCVGPGCGMPADRCQIDHTIAWEHGGHTSLDNNAPLCQGHHTIRHHGNWSIRQLPDSGGVIEWTSPTGRHYLVEPERRVPTFRTAVTADNEPAPF